MDSKIFELALQWQGMHNYLFTNYKKRKRKKKKKGIISWRRKGWKHNDREYQLWVDLFFFF